MQRVRQLFYCVLREPLFLISMLLMVIACCAPLVFSLPVFGDWTIDYELQSALNAMKQNVESDAFNNLDFQTQSYLENQYRYIDAAEAAETKQEKYRSYSNYCEASLDAIDSGLLMANRQNMEAEYRYSLAVARLSNEMPFYTSADLPGLYYISYALGSLPCIVWLIPSLCSSFLIASNHAKKSLIGTGRQSHWQQWLTGMAAAIIQILAMFITSCAIVFLLATIKNGVGNPSYPVVFWRGDSLIESDALMTYAELATLFVISNVWITCFSMLAVELGKPLFGPVLAIAFALVPMIDGYTESGGILSDFASLVPVSYFGASLYIGYIGLYPTVGTAVMVDGSFERGVIVLLLSLIAIAGITILSIAYKRGKAKRIYLADSMGDSLRVDHLSLSYSSREILADGSISLSPSVVWGLIAPNGDGKTTLMRAIAGDYSTIRKGNIRFPTGVRPNCIEVSEQVFFLEDTSSSLFPRLTVREHLNLCKTLWCSTLSSDEAIARFELKGYENVQAGKLSQGMRGCLICALAFVSDASFVLLDEPTAFMDQSRAKGVLRQIRCMAQEGKGVLISSHSLDLLSEAIDGCTAIVQKAFVELDGGDLHEWWKKLYEREA